MNDQPPPPVILPPETTTPLPPQLKWVVDRNFDWPAPEVSDQDRKMRA